MAFRVIMTCADFRLLVQDFSREEPVVIEAADGTDLMGATRWRKVRLHEGLSEDLSTKVIGQLADMVAQLKKP